MQIEHGISEKLTIISKGNDYLWLLNVSYLIEFSLMYRAKVISSVGNVCSIVIFHPRYKRHTSKKINKKVTESDESFVHDFVSCGIVPITLSFFCCKRAKASPGRRKNFISKG
ncbi:hypothetical protein RM11_1166 [Bartonella quintana RM-11]|nr:hypothetical protein RM11_1166 [Bartonella quintana RM-11]